MGFTDDELSQVYDKTDGYCGYCGKKLAFTNYGRIGERGAWEVDHSVPKSRGGTNYVRNLVPACIECNRQKGTRMGKSVRALTGSSIDSSTPSLGEIILAAGTAVAIVYLSDKLLGPRDR
jgi:hypothetical protein